MEAIIALLFLSVVIANLVLAVLVFIKAPKNPINISFSIFTTTLAFWIASNYFTNNASPDSLSYAVFWVKMCYIFAMSIPSSLLYFSLVFPNGAAVSKKTILELVLPPLLLTALVPTDLIVQGVIFSDQGSVLVNFGLLHPLYVVYYLAYLLMFFYVLGRKLIFLQGSLKIQVKYVVIGLSVPFVLAVMVNIILPVMGIAYGSYVLHNIGALSMTVFTGMTTYAIVKHRLLGFNVFFGKTIVYSVLAGFVTAMYFGFLYVVARMFQGISGNYSMIIGLFFFFFFAILFEPLRDRLQIWVDKIFFKAKFNYEKALKETSSAMSLLSDMDRLLKITARLITRRMKLNGAALFLLNEKKGRFEVKGSDGIFKNLAGFSMSLNYPIIELLEESKLPQNKQDIEKMLIDPAITPEERLRQEKVLSDFIKIDVELFVPSVMKNNLVAFLALGGKLSREDFNEDDMNFLTTLANQSAIFVENSMLLEKEKEGAKKLAEADVREKYTATLEKVNKELLETREQLVKAERLSTLTKLTVSLQHEINNPLTSVLAQSQVLIMKMNADQNVPMDFIKERLITIEREAKRIRELLRNLVNITEPVVREYIPGTEMIDISASSKTEQ